MAYDAVIVCEEWAHMYFHPQRKVFFEGIFDRVGVHVFAVAVEKKTLHLKL